jgi:RHS repeat-associated protein
MVGIANEVWYLVNPPTGSNTVSVTVTGATDAIKLTASSWTGVDQSTPIPLYTAALGVSGNPTVSLTTTSANNVVLASLDRYSNTTATTNRTPLTKDTSGSLLSATSYQQAPTAGSYSDTYTGSASQDWAMYAIALKPATQQSGTSTASTTLRYILADHLGSTHVVTDTTGSIVEASDYYAYGAPRIDSKTGSFSGEQRKYIGQYYDAFSQLSYLNSRFYDSQRGQFLSEDPVFWGEPQKQDLQNPQNLNSYSYAANNPIIKSDPSGK